MYRFYHTSFKVYEIQEETRAVVEALRAQSPDGRIHSTLFLEICEQGASGVAFAKHHNAAWARHTRPFLEAFLHARYFLETAVKYGRALYEPPSRLPSGWAALLELYGLRYVPLAVITPLPDPGR